MRIIEKSFSAQESGLSVGIANIGQTPGNLEANQDRIIDALDTFSAHQVNLAIFPEYSLSGYFRDIFRTGNKLE
ncbi:MAG: hypothetical protein D3926_03765 [Desulfobacteraceae bacterium]|mgnify:CR=1 FL=1|nr:MAG: hypothetical protein D3926_03765 [Desulfobacteraceae bacterium]